MHPSTSLTTLLTLLLPLTTAHPTCSPTSTSPTTPSASIRPILTLSPGAWFENLAVRPDGTLLVTRLDTPSLYHVDPSTGTYTIIADFPGVTAALGIAEYAPDIFAVAVANFSRETFTGVPGTSSIQTIDLSQGLGTDGRVTPELLVEVPDAGMLNGMAFRAPSTIYAADSFGFRVWGVDTRTREVEVAVGVNELFGTKPGGRFPAGINGLKWDGVRERLVFTDTNQVLAGSVRWEESEGGFGEPVEIARGLNGTVLFDDLDFDARTGDLFVANGGSGGVNWVRADGKAQAVVRQENEVVLNTPVATRFGRDAKANVLYVTTAGADASGNPAPGQIVEYTLDFA